MKIKKKVIIILSIIVFLIISTIITFIIINKNKERKEKKLINDIKDHYYKTVVVTRNAKLYNSNNKVIGEVKKDFVLKLDDKKINRVNDKYFKIANTNYLINYKDVKKTREIQSDIINDKYIPYNEKVNLKNQLLYKDDKEVLKINDNLFENIKYKDQDYYYIYYLDRLLKVKKSNLKIDYQNFSEDKESDYISVINLPNITSDKNNNDDNYVKLDLIKEMFNYLKENGYYTINLTDYENYLNDFIRLKEKAVLITTNSNDDIINNLKKEYNVVIDNINDYKNIVFKDTNSKSVKGIDMKNVPRYSLKNYSTIDSVKKMINGENVKEVKKEVIKKSNGIPVLNYHFFYDPSNNESCNEHICLDVKKFREQLSYLKENGYKTLTMEEFRAWMYKEIKLPEKSVLITVDDGAMGTGLHNGNKLNPILKEYNMHATLFLIAGWWDVNNYKSPYLDIQSHSYDMHDYGTCKKGHVVCASHDELLADLKKSLEIVDNNNSFCFPFYSYSESAIETIKEAGFKLAFIGGNKKATQNSNYYKIPRYPIHKNITMDQFIKMIS